MELTEYLLSQGRGAVSQLAKVIGAHIPDVSRWESKQRPIPFHHCAAIETATRGAVTVEELRPNVSWTRIPDPDWPHPEGRPLLDFAPDRPAAQGGV